MTATVRLIAISKPVIEDVPDTAALLAYCARVSSSANQLNHATGPKLLKSLITRQEWSPLEMVSLTLEIVTTRDIARQILRHRSFSFQEFSQRYAKVEAAPVFREARLQDTKDRQNSIEGVDEEIGSYWQSMQQATFNTAITNYNTALEMGIAKEVARALLPEGMTESRLFMAGTLRSWLHYAWLRADRKTQKEHRIIAQQALEIIVEQFPDLRDVVLGQQS